MKSDGGEGGIQKADRILDKVTHIATMALFAPAAVALAAWTFLFGVYIISRTIFNVNWTFVEEFTGYWLVMLAFFSLSYGLRTGVHVRIESVLGLLSRKVRSILIVITDFLALILVCYLTWRTVGWVQYGLADQPHSSFPSHLLLWPTYLLVPIGLAVLALALLLQVYRDAIQVVQGERESRSNGERG